MEKNKDKKKPLKLSSSGRLQIRKNLGPAGDRPKNTGSKKTIQIVFRNKNNQQKSSSTTQSNFRGSSSFRSQNAAQKITPSPNFFNQKNRDFGKNKKTTETKKTLQKKSTLKPHDEENEKINVKKILEQEEQEFDKFPSLAKLKRAREKEKLKAQDENTDNKIGREVTIPEVINVQDLANRMAEKTADVVKTLMKMGVMANATQALDAETAGIVATELGQDNSFAGIVLESPFTSIADAAKIYYPYLPIDLLLKDRYDSLKKNQKYKCSYLGDAWQER